MTEKWILSNKSAGVEDRIVYAIRGIFAIYGNVGPDLEKIQLGARSKGKAAYRRSMRHCSFMASI